MSQYQFSKGYREELIATTAILMLVSLASFYGMYQLAPTQKTQVLGVEDQADDEPEVIAPESDTQESTQPSRDQQARLEEIFNQPATESASPTPQPSPSDTSTGSSETETDQTEEPPETEVEIPYGAGQEYENDDYIITFDNPRLVVTQSRTFYVNVVIANKDIEAGIDNVLSARLTDDQDQVITDTAPLSLSEIAKIMPGEQLSFQASLKLPEDSQLTRISYKPENASNTNYNLDPTF